MQTQPIATLFVAVEDNTGETQNRTDQLASGAASQDDLPSTQKHQTAPAINSTRIQASQKIRTQASELTDNLRPS
jgi:hypothetical protein